MLRLVAEVETLNINLLIFLEMVEPQITETLY
jgi:hypothetical protein